MNTLPTRPDPHEGLHSGGGWSPPAHQPPKDTRPEYSPGSLVLDVIEVLHRAGIALDPGPVTMDRAKTEAADLLEALGIRPVTAPRRSR